MFLIVLTFAIILGDEDLWKKAIYQLTVRIFYQS